MRAYTSTVLLAWDFVIFCWLKTEVDERLVHLMGATPKHFWKWLEDCRLKFVRYQYHDLPAYDMSERLRVIEASIAHLADENEPTPAVRTCVCVRVNACLYIHSCAIIA